MEGSLSPEKKRRKMMVFFGSIILFFVLIFLGTIGYKLLFDLSWMDAFYNAATIFSGGNKLDQPFTTGQKLFVVVYTLFATVIFISIAAHAIKDVMQMFEKSEI